MFKAKCVNFPEVDSHTADRRRSLSEATTGQGETSGPFALKAPRGTAVDLLQVMTIGSSH